MTEQELDVEQEEIERMKNLLRTSSEHISQHEVDQDDKNSRNKKRRKLEQHECDSQKGEKEYCSIHMEENNSTTQGDDIQYTIDETDIILPLKKKKKLPKKKAVELTPEELKMAKSKHKALQRKLNQIEQRHERKKKRAELYATLSAHAVSETEIMLMDKSADLGKRVSKKEMLKKLLQKERAGILLTEEEKEMLYTCTERSEESLQNGNVNFEIAGVRTGVKSNDINDIVEKEEVIPLAFSSTGKKKKRKKSKEKAETPVDLNEVENYCEINGKPEERSSSCQTSSSTDMDINVKAQPENQTTSFAAQMMAGLSTLKADTLKQKAEFEEKRKREQLELEMKRAEKEKEELGKRKVYIPRNTAILKSAAAMGLQPKDTAVKDGWRVLPVQRPKEVESSRFDLPVSAMEYEIIDSIRNNSVTIICSETGSGKSTQVPQFLYESGITLGNAKSVGEDDGLLICVTQPRRVAAVSTAKRVCYEMGFSNDKGQSIQGRKCEGNVVAYQTKYETAGLGSKTRIKFMTDGILLQEIKSDLLLRKYAGQYS
jgi:ATP-dependent RNA helicase DHX37/DHR1